MLADREPTKRQGAYVTMAMMAEGCAEIICRGSNLPILLKACVKGMEDENSQCRKHALEAITQFSTHVQLEVLKHHDMLLPPIFHMFERDNEDVKVLESALNAIEMFIDSVDEDDVEGDFKIENYLPNIMETIVSFFFYFFIFDFFYARVF